VAPPPFEKDVDAVGSTGKNHSLLAHTPRTNGRKWVHLCQPSGLVAWRQDMYIGSLFPVWKLVSMYTLPFSNSGIMNMFGITQRPAARKPTTQPGYVRTKKRHSNRERSDVGSGERSIHNWLGTVVEGPENVARTKEVHKLPISTVKEPVNMPDLESGQTEGTDDLLSRIAAIEKDVRSIKQVVGEVAVAQHESAAAHENLVRRFQQRAEADGAVISAQNDVIDRWKQDVGALVTTLKRVVGSSTTPAVSATVGAVKKDVEDLGSVQAASNLKTDRNGELKPRKKENSGLVVAETKENEGKTMYEEEMEEKPKVNEEVAGVPAFLLGLCNPLRLLNFSGFSMSLL
jgi:hypothetical protein